MLRRALSFLEPLKELPVDQRLIQPKKLRSPRIPRKVRVCVLYSSYEGTDSPTQAVDDILCTPRNWVDRDKDKYEFIEVAVKKAESYSMVRELLSSGSYDVFYNLCDGARDEKRAGVDVVQALEALNAAFTGADSKSFEPSKIDMKILVANANVKTPNFVLLNNTKDLRKKCRHLKFPVIVKHISGYASVGITPASRCETPQQLRTQVEVTLARFNSALVEEFIAGREGTVLVCADQKCPFGIRVFQPIMYTWLKGSDDFAHFDSKWSWDSTIEFMPKDDPAYREVQSMARNAFWHIMRGVGYGRCDFRINDRNEVFFLEINPNCGMLYDPKEVEGGDFADMMISQERPKYSHDDFIGNAIKAAREAQRRRAPWYCVSHDQKGSFTTRASVTVPTRTALFSDSVHPVPVIGRALYQLGVAAAPVGCVICRGDGINTLVAMRHSCEPNMQFVHGTTLTFESSRQISRGEELTVDYATLRDPHMPEFACSCGTASCRGIVSSDLPRPRIAGERLKQKAASFTKILLGLRQKELIDTVDHAKTIEAKDASLDIQKKHAS